MQSLRSIRSRVLVVTAATLLPIAAILVYNELALRKDRERELHELAFSAARQANLEMERLATGAEGTLRAISAEPAVKSLDPSGCHDYLAQVSPELPQFTAIAVADASGIVRCLSNDAGVGTDVSDRPYFRQAAAEPDHLAVGEYIIGRVTHAPSLPMALSIDDRQGRFVGAVVAGLDLKWLGSTIRDRQLSKNASLTIADRNGTILAREPFPEKFLGTVIPDQFQGLVRADQPGTIELTSQDGTRRILGYIPPQIPPVGLYVSAGISKADAFAPINAASWRAGLVGAAGALTSLGLSLLLAQRLVTREVGKILAVLKRRQSGDRAARTGMAASQGELGEIGASLDEYLEALEHARQAQDREEERRDLLITEVSHRMKNLLATVQAVAGQSFRGDRDTSESLKAFNARLGAIAKAQQMLVFGQGDQTSLEQVLRDSIEVFEPSPGQRFELSGGNVQLDPKAAFSLAMAVHELCTNAVKYGALSNDHGRVTIHWTSTVEPDPRLRLEWRETGGPVATPTGKAGFGSILIERVLTQELGGSATLNYEPTGLRYSIEFPVHRAVQV